PTNGHTHLPASIVETTRAINLDLLPLVISCAVPSEALLTVHVHAFHSKPAIEHQQIGTFPRGDAAQLLFMPRDPGRRQSGHANHLYQRNCRQAVKSTHTLVHTHHT